MGETATQAQAPDDTLANFTAPVKSELEKLTRVLLAANASASLASDLGFFDRVVAFEAKTSRHYVLSLPNLESVG